jgi:hypothetical protein
MIRCVELVYSADILTDIYSSCFVEALGLSWYLLSSLPLLLDVWLPLSFCAARFLLHLAWKALPTQLPLFAVVLCTLPMEVKCAIIIISIVPLERGRRTIYWH